MMNQSVLVLSLFYSHFQCFERTFSFQTERSTLYFLNKRPQLKPGSSCDFFLRYKLYPKPRPVPVDSVPCLQPDFYAYGNGDESSWSYDNFVQALLGYGLLLISPGIYLDQHVILSKGYSKDDTSSSSRYEAYSFVWAEPMLKPVLPYFVFAFWTYRSDNKPVCLPRAIHRWSFYSLGIVG